MLWPDSFAGPVEAVTKELTVCAVASSSTVTVGWAKLIAGASFTAVIVMVKVLVALSTPPLPVPPSSCATTVIVATPKAFRAGVKVSVPFVAIAGAVENRLLLVVLTA